jgi:hypothetical protein
MPSYIDAVLGSCETALGHLVTEYVDDLESTLATVTARPTYAFMPEPGTMTVITDPDEVRQFYIDSRKEFKPAVSRVMTHIATDWYEFLENVPTRYDLIGSRDSTLNTVVLFPNAGDGIQGEFLWERAPADDPAPLPVPEELNPTGVIPTVRLRNAKMHERYLDTLSAGRIDDVVTLLSRDSLWAVRSYAPDAGPAPMIKAEGREQVREVLEAWSALFEVERAAVTTRLATEWYVFADELYTVKLKTGPQVGQRREFRQAVIYPLNRDGLIQGALGYGTEMVPATARANMKVGKISYLREGYSDTLCDPVPRA